MATGKTFNEVESHFSKRIYYILWRIEIGAFMIVVFLGDTRQNGELTARGLGFICIFGLIVAIAVGALALKSINPEGRKWLIDRPPSFLDSKPPGRTMQLAIWGVPLLGIVGVFIGRFLFS